MTRSRRSWRASPCRAVGLLWKLRLREFFNLAETLDGSFDSDPLTELGVAFRSDDCFWLGPRLAESSAAAALPIELDLLWWGYKTTGLVVLASTPAVSGLSTLASALATVVGSPNGAELSPELRFEDWSKLFTTSCTSMRLSSLGVALSLEPGEAPGAIKDPLDDDTANK